MAVIPQTSTWLEEQLRPSRQIGALTGRELPSRYLREMGYGARLAELEESRRAGEEARAQGRWEKEYGLKSSIAERQIGLQESALEAQQRSQAMMGYGLAAGALWETGLPQKAYTSVIKPAIGYLTGGTTAMAMGTGATSAAELGALSAGETAAWYGAGAAAGGYEAGAAAGTELAAAAGTSWIPPVAIGLAVVAAATMVFGDGGKIVCTELSRRGYLTQKVLAKDSECRIRYIPMDVYAGYLTLFSPVVWLMRKSFLFTQIVRPFGIACAYEMASRVDGEIKGNRLGKFLLKIGIPLCRLIGQMRIRRLVEV